MNSVPLGTVSYIQQMLRTISCENENVISVIPDGLFEIETKNSVMSFQNEYGLEANGKVGYDTWNKLVEEFGNVNDKNSKNVKMQVFNENRIPIKYGEKCAEIYVLQAMIIALSDKFDNIGTIYATGVYDEPTENAVQNVKALCGISPGGAIDTEFINALTELYNANVSQNRMENYSFG